MSLLLTPFLTVSSPIHGFIVIGIVFAVAIVTVILISTAVTGLYFLYKRYSSCIVHMYYTWSHLISITELFVIGYPTEFGRYLV